MNKLGVAHLILVSTWGGVVLAETILEVLGRKDTALAVRAHYFIDILVEIPLLISVLLTGTLLLLRSWPPSWLLWAKLISASIAVAVNLGCAVFVILRYRHRHDPALAERYGRLVRYSGLGVPFGVGSAYLGLAYFS